MWSMAKVRDSYNMYVVKCDGRPVGTLKTAYKPRSAGGTQWEGKIDGHLVEELYGSGCAGVCFYSKDKQKVLNWFKTEGFSMLCRAGSFDG